MSYWLLKKIGKREGVALITTLMIVALLVGIVVEFSRIAIAEIDISKNFGDEKKILFLTVSGVNAIKELLRLEGLYSTSDNLLEEWAKSRTYFESASSMLDEGKIEGEIFDENRKINVNLLLQSQSTEIWMPIFPLECNDRSFIIVHLYNFLL